MIDGQQCLSSMTTIWAQKIQSSLTEISVAVEKQVKTIIYQDVKGQLLEQHDSLKYPAANEDNTSAIEH
jgi:hypothetical protein